MIFRVLADAAAIVHFGFVLFVALGALAVARWPRIAWLHLPAVAWGVAIEWSGLVCPLTPLENHLRLRAGLEGYPGGFIEQYLLPALYPAGLTRELQLALGALALGLNLALYGWLWKRYRKRHRAA